MIHTHRTNELSPPSWPSNCYYNFSGKIGETQAECFNFENNLLFYMIINCIVSPTLILKPKVKQGKTVSVAR